jgi:Protein of unknown function (DUF1592)/Protein of unknown function (DUF1595)/Protein of unknown function (DUF1588)/Protein of unknown function (DUF1585)/Protein of unknown function (DUF1587)
MRQNDRTRGKWPRFPRRTRAPRFGALLLSAALVTGCGVTQRNPVPDGDDGDGPHPAQGGSETSPPVAGGAGASGGSGGSGGSTQINLMGSPAYHRFVRLTNAQWAASVKEVVGLAASPDVVAGLPTPVLGVADFSNNERLLDVDARLWMDFQTGAEEVAARATASERALAAVYPGTDVTGFIETVGRRAYRRPLTADEVESLKALFDAGAAMSGEQSSFAKGAALVLRGLLQSPFFIYRAELGETGAPLSGYEAAAKLSLWLRGATPTEALLDLAPTLTSADALEAEAARMLEEESAREVMRGFHDEYLHLSRYDVFVRVVDGELDTSLAGELRETSALFLDRIFQGAGLREMLTSTSGFVGAGLAPLYGIEAPESGVVFAELGPARAGYFSQVPYLALHGNFEQASALRRGVPLALDALCMHLPFDSAPIPPPPPIRPGETARDRVNEITAECGGACHNEIINPLGFAFEHFDGNGQYRELDNGSPVDSSGSFTFDEGRRDFRDNVELMSQIADSRQAHLCYAKKVAGYALQRDIAEADLPLLGELAAVSQSGGSLKAIMRSLARSEAFRTHVGGSP